MGNRVQLDNMGKRILSAIRNELYLHLHFMGPALNSLRYEMDLWTKTIGTDAVSIRFNPNYLFQTYLEHPYLLDRVYMHMLMHCLFRHMFYGSAYPDTELWNLCADIAAESVVDSIDDPVVQVVPSDFRESCYRKLKKEVGVLTAQRLYRYFSERPRDYVLEDRMAAEFARDDHSFWERMREDEKKQDQKKPQGQNPADPSSSGDRQEDEAKEDTKEAAAPLLFGRSLQDVDEDWKKNAKRIEAELFVSGKRSSRDTGDLERMLALENRKRTSYRDFLKQFAVVREEAKVDPDSFDYSFYNYGMQLYGNMPLIEENEYREGVRVQDLVIVIDTSASCQDTLVQQFLNETAAILANADSFFLRTDIHIIECDDRVQKDLVIHNPEEMQKYAKAFHVKGGGGTDFRPAFRYVDDLIRQGSLQNMKGLLYFTDGFGIYPEKPPLYETAFLFWKDEELNDREVPDWAMRVYLDDEQRNVL